MSTALLHEAVTEETILASIDEFGNTEAYLQDTGSRELILSSLWATEALEQAVDWNDEDYRNMARLYYLSVNPRLDALAAGRIASLIIDRLTPPASLILARRLAANPSLSEEDYELLLAVHARDKEVKQALAANPSVGCRVLRTLLLEDAETAGIVMANPGCSVHLRESAPLGIKAQFETEMADVLCEIASASTAEDFAYLEPRLGYGIEPMDVVFAANPNLPEDLREILVSRGGTASWIIINNTHSGYYTT